MYDRLIYGKDETEGIVSLEVNDNGVVELFKADGSTEVRNTKFWILSDTNNNGWIKLKGNQHYQYGKQFSKRDEWMRTRMTYKHRQDVYSIYEPKEAYMVNSGVTYFKGLKASDLSVLAFDIESTSLYHDDTAKILIIANTFRDNTGKITRKLFTYENYDNCGEMIQDWARWVRQVNPTIICGHNVVAYDLPYMQYLCDKYNCTMDLGRDGSAVKFDSYQSRFRKDQTQFIEYYRPRAYGREIVDTLFLAIKYDNVAKKYESYNLKKIIEAEGITQEGRVFYDAGNIKNTYKIPTEWEKIKAYAIYDGDDALALYDLFIPPYFYMTQSVPKSFQAMIESATGSQINSVMVRSYLQEGHSIAKATDVEHFEGAISFGNAGIYKNVVKVDISSLYPSIMRQYKVYDSNKDPNGNFLRLVDTLTIERLKNKKLAKTEKHYDDLQSAQKITINSCYGFMGASGLNYNSIRNAELVTSRGREILQHSIKWAEDKGYKIVNADTDSISYSKKDDTSFSELEMKNDLNDLNSTLPELIKFEADGYFFCLVVFKAKNYVMYDGKSIKKKGSALKSSSKELALKNFSDDMIQAIIDDRNNFVEIYNKYVFEAMNLNAENIKAWSSKKSISKKVMTNERTNEAKIRDAIEGEEIVEGDKVYVYFKNDGSLSLCDKFDGDYDKEKMLEKLYNSTKLFATVIDTTSLLNYSLKRNQEALYNLLGLPYEAPKRVSRKKKTEQMEMSIENCGN